MREDTTTMENLPRHVSAMNPPMSGVSGNPGPIIHILGCSFYVLVQHLCKVMIRLMPSPNILSFSVNSKTAHIKLFVIQSFERKRNEVNKSKRLNSLS